MLRRLPLQKSRLERILAQAVYLQVEGRVSEYCSCRDCLTRSGYRAMGTEVASMPNGNLTERVAWKLFPRRVFVEGLGVDRTPGAPPPKVACAYTTGWDLRQRWRPGPLEDAHVSGRHEVLTATGLRNGSAMRWLC